MYSIMIWLIRITKRSSQKVSEYPSPQQFSRVQFFVTPWTAASKASLSIINSRSSLKLMSIESVTPSNHIILCHPLLLLPSIFPIIRVFSNESALRIRWPKYWSFSFSISPSNEHPGLISCRMDWLDLLAVQGALKSLLQHHSSKASILQCSSFFAVQMSHQCMTTGKVVALTRGTFAGRVMSLLFNILSTLVTTLLPRSKCLLMCCCCCSLTQFSPTICDSVDSSAPRRPVLHHLPELAGTHVHWVWNVIQPSRPLSSPSPLALNLSQHQGLFQ